MINGGAIVSVPYRGEWGFLHIGQSLASTIQHLFPSPFEVTEVSYKLIVGQTGDGKYVSVPSRGEWGGLTEETSYRRIIAANVSVPSRGDWAFLHYLLKC